MYFSHFRVTLSNHVELTVDTRKLSVEYWILGSKINKAVLLIPVELDDVVFGKCMQLDQLGYQTLLNHSENDLTNYSFEST